MAKAAVSKALLVKINLTFLFFFIVAYVAIIALHPSFLYDQGKVDGAAQQKLIRERRAAFEKAPSFHDSLNGNLKIGLVNMGDDELLRWQLVGRAVNVKFESVSENLKWRDLFPEWIDEEEENGKPPSCPEIPMPEFSSYGKVDMIVARLPCRGRRPESAGDYARDVLRLQIHLIAANLAVKNGKRDDDGRGGTSTVKVVFHSACRPMVELFPCEELVAREGQWWVYKVRPASLEEKVRLPVGSCKLALPLWGEGTKKEYDVSKLGIAPATPHRRREAYSTVLHSSDNYVCGAITLGQSIIRAGSTRDLVLLHDRSISGDQLQALANAGWSLRLIERIRNPRAREGSYNEYNYSKLRLWQLLEYDKVVFIDADILILRNHDALFHLPQLSAVGNDGVIFNSGIMVIEPSNCTFQALMERLDDIVSYNGGDQGFLNEVFVWWHRLPRRTNFMKTFWSNTTKEVARKNRLFAAVDPPELYGIHYLGLKPWMCYRDYDCNWNVDNQRVFASDVAHRTWWWLHDAMDDRLKEFCRLSEKRRVYLQIERQRAEELGFADGHWRLKIADLSTRNVSTETSIA